MPEFPWEDFQPAVAEGPWSDFAPRPKRTREQIIANTGPSSESEVPFLTRVGSAMYEPIDVIRRMMPVNAAKEALMGLTELGRGNVKQALYGPSPEVQERFNMPSVSPETAQKAIEFFSPGGRAPEATPALGVQQFLADLASGLTTFEGMGGLASGRISPRLPQVQFGGGMIQDVPQAITALQQAHGGAETTKNALRLGLDVLGPLGIARADVSKAPTPSGLTAMDIPSSLADIPLTREMSQEYLNMVENQRRAAQGYSVLPRREAQQPPVIIGEQPQPRQVFYVQPQSPIEPGLGPTVPPVEPSGGEISFRSPAAGYSVPSARQSTLTEGEQNASTIRSTQEEIPQTRNVGEGRGETRGQNLQRLPNEVGGEGLRGQELRQETQGITQTRLRPGNAPKAIAEQPFSEIPYRYFIRLKGTSDAFEVQSLVDSGEKFKEVTRKSPNNLGADILDETGKIIGEISPTGNQKIFPERPPIARLGTSTIKNNFGDPIGTQYVGAPEDVAAYQSIESRVAEEMKKGVLTPEGNVRHEITALNKEREALKNKYGGMPPQAERVVSAAIRLNGKIGEGVDHADAVHDYAKKYGIEPNDIWSSDGVDSGFMTSSGRFVDLDEAARISGKSGKASHASEILSQQEPPRLYSVPGMFFDPEFYKQTARNTVKLGQDLQKFMAAGPVKERVSQLLDAADNQAKITGRTIGNRIRVALPSQQDRNALTFVVEANGNVQRLQQFLTQTVDDPKAQQAIRYAIANVNRLAPHAREATRLMDEQRTLERQNGVMTDEAPNYIKHAYETRNVDFFDPGASGSGVSTAFKKQRVFATYADAIEAGYKPKTFNAADLIESRVAAGMKMVNRMKWGEALSGLKDPTSQEPLTKAMVTQPKGTQVAPSGYQPREILPGVRVAVKDGYTGIFDALTGRSDVSNSWLGRTALQTEGTIKHGLLLFDTFHASRVLQKQMFLTGEVGYKKGLSLLEYDNSTLGRLERNGDIDTKTADWVRANRPVAELGLRNGLNVGRIAEALYSDVIRKELPLMGIDVNVPGRFNRWVFDKMTRGAVIQSFIIEFERTQKNHPEWTPDKMAGYAAKQINVYFGNLGRQGLFKSATKQDALQLAFLAPQWFESMIQTEARAAKQGAQVPVDLAMGKGFNVGTAAKGVGTGLFAYVIGTQLLNKYTTGHFTWDNEDKDHKLDAYIPDPTGKSPGFWISPLSVVAEVSHDVLRYSHTKKNALGVAGQIIQNKFSPLLRAEETLRTQRDYAGNKILGAGEVAKQAARSLIPVPLPASGLTSEQSGQTQRQLYGSLGLKVEIANRREADQNRLAQEMFNKDFKDLTPQQRIKLSKQPKETTPGLQERYTIAQHATDKEFESLQHIQTGLSPNVQQWLKDKGVTISAPQEFKQIAKGQVRLTDNERVAFEKLATTEYENVLSRLAANPRFENMKSQDVQRYVNVNLEIARKKVWAATLKEIRKGGAERKQ